MNNSEKKGYHLCIKNYVWRKNTLADKEEIKTLEELEEKGRVLREYKEKFRQMCQENKMIKGSTVLKLYDKIEEIQREYELFR